MVFPLPLRYLFGDAAAIRSVASSSSSIWTGIALVLMTAVARNYDQTLIGESPVMWFFGPLLFSLISGSWLYLIAYSTLARRELESNTAVEAIDGRSWKCFMGLFWMTAPIAWLYAIPVERWTDTMTSTRLNLLLLAIVALWRVLLMARVFQVLCEAPFRIALVWVLLPASIEAAGVFFFNQSLGKRIMMSMAGLRNSPEEDVMKNAMDNAFGMSVVVFIASIILVFAWRMRSHARPFPPVSPSRASIPVLGLLAAAWLCIAIEPQKELSRTVEVASLINSGRGREALNYLAAHKPGDFAPARELAPLMFEVQGINAFPDVFAALRPEDPPWVRQLMFHKLDRLRIHLIPRGAPKGSNEVDEWRITMLYGVSENPAAPWLKIVTSLPRTEDGRRWLENNRPTLQVLADNLEDITTVRTAPDLKVQDEWMKQQNALRESLRTLGFSVPEKRTESTPVATEEPR